MQVGDKIRCVSGHPEDGLIKDAVYTVGDVGFDGLSYFVKLLDGPSNSLPWRNGGWVQSRFEVVETAPRTGDKCRLTEDGAKFAVGDVARVIGTDVDRPITDRIKDGEFRWMYRFEGDPIWHADWYAESSLTWPA